MKIGFNKEWRILKMCKKRKNLITLLILLLIFYSTSLFAQQVPETTNKNKYKVVVLNFFDASPFEKDKLGEKTADGIRSLLKGLGIYDVLDVREIEGFSINKADLFFENNISELEKLDIDIIVYGELKKPVLYAYWTPWETHYYYDYTTKQREEYKERYYKIKVDASISYNVFDVKNKKVVYSDILNESREETAKRFRSEKSQQRSFFRECIRETLKRFIFKFQEIFPLKGSILEKIPEKHRVLINVGTIQGVKKGMIFAVYEQNEQIGGEESSLKIFGPTIGELRVEDVSDKISETRILGKQWRKVFEQIQPGMKIKSVPKTLKEREVNHLP